MRKIKEKTEKATNGVWVDEREKGFRISRVRRLGQRIENVATLELGVKFRSSCFKKQWFF